MEFRECKKSQEEVTRGCANEYRLSRKALEVHRVKFDVLDTSNTSYNGLHNYIKLTALCLDHLGYLATIWSLVPRLLATLLKIALSATLYLLSLSSPSEALLSVRLCCEAAYRVFRTTSLMFSLYDRSIL